MEVEQLDDNDILRRQISIYRQKARVDNEALFERLDRKGPVISQCV